MSLPPSADSAAIEAEQASQQQRLQLQRQRRRQYPKDDDVLSSIRAVRRMVELEFGQADRQRRRRKSSKGSKQQQLAVEEKRDDADNGGGGGGTKDAGDSDFDNAAATSWKHQCFRLKQELFEAKNRSTDLEDKHKDEMAEAASKLKEALAEASQNRELKDTLVETLKAQTKHSEGIAKQLAESRKNSKTLQAMWKDLVQTMEEEKEAMDQERSTSLQLLEETQQRLASSLADQDRIEKEASVRTEELAKRIQELESTNTKLALENENSAKKLQQQQQQQLSPSWNKSKTRSNLQQKLRELEDSLAKDAKTIRALEQQIGSTRKPKETSSKTTSLATSLATKKSQLNEKKNRLRSKSLSVLGEVIRMQLQRLMEIHSQTTSTTTTETSATAGAKHNAESDEEWKSILEKLSQNRAKVFELRKENFGKDGAGDGSPREAALPTEKKKRCGVGNGIQATNDGSPTKKPKTKN